MVVDSGFGFELSPKSDFPGIGILGGLGLNPDSRNLLRLPRPRPRPRLSARVFSGSFFSFLSAWKKGYTLD